MLAQGKNNSMKALSRLKGIIVRIDNLLGHYDLQTILILSVDSSPVRSGAVISHERKHGERSVAFTLQDITKI